MPKSEGESLTLSTYYLEHLKADIILPAQFYGPMHATTPERRLLLVILDDAVHQLLTTRGKSRRHAQDIHREVLAWLATDEDAVNARGEITAWSFRTVCEHLGIEADCLRQRLLDPEASVPRQTGAQKRLRRAV